MYGNAACVASAGFVHHTGNTRPTIFGWLRIGEASNAGGPAPVRIFVTLAGIGIAGRYFVGGTENT